MYQNGRPMGSGNFPPALNPAGTIATRRPVVRPLMALNAWRETEPAMSGEEQGLIADRSPRLSLVSHRLKAGAKAPVFTRGMVYGPRSRH
jgi:hypothetical protein